jgi:hypothetical protein
VAKVFSSSQKVSLMLSGMRVRYQAANPAAASRLPSRYRQAPAWCGNPGHGMTTTVPGDADAAHQGAEVRVGVRVVRDLDWLGERLRGLDSTLIATNLTDAERGVLLGTFVGA